MENPGQYFNKVLEQYTFKVANLFIESAEPAAQSEFIKLINNIHTNSNPIEDHAELSSSGAKESEWQQILNNPAAQVSIHRLWLIDLIHKRIEHHKICMAQFEQAVYTNEQHRQRIQATNLREPYRSNLLNQREQSLSYLQQRLAATKSALQSDLKKLRQFELSELNRKAYR